MMLLCNSKKKGRKLMLNIVSDKNVLNNKIITKEETEKLLNQTKS